MNRRSPSLRVGHFERLPGLAGPGSSSDSIVIVGHNGTSRLDRHVVTIVRYRHHFASNYRSPPHCARSVSEANCIRNPSPTGHALSPISPTARLADHDRLHPLTEVHRFNLGQRVTIMSSSSNRKQLASFGGGSIDDHASASRVASLAGGWIVTRGCNYEGRRCRRDSRDCHNPE